MLGLTLEVPTTYGMCMSDSDESSSVATLEPTQSRLSDEGVAKVVEAIGPAFDKVFGEGASKGDEGKSPSTASKRAAAEEEAESLELEEEEAAGATSDSDSDEDTEDGEEDAEGEEESDEEEGAEASASKGGKGKKGDDEGDDKSPTIPAIMLQSAKRAGWSDEEAEKFYVGQPELAIKTFDRLHATYNDLTNQYARLGRTHAEPEDQPTDPSPRRRASASGDILTDIYGEDELSTLREKFGEDFADDVLQPLVGPLQELYAHYESQKEAAIGQQLESFFKDLPKDYDDLYGNGSVVTDAHVQNRDKLALLADQVRAGAELQGMSMSVPEALDRAHLVVSAPHLETIERKKLIGNVKKRSSRMSARPTQRKSGKKDGEGERSIASAEAAYAEKAAELGYDV